MSGNLETLKKARDELRKQFVDCAGVVAKGFEQKPSYSEAIENLNKLGKAIDALDRAIDGAWAARRTG
jgi:hypothetical protein